MFIGVPCGDFEDSAGGPDTKNVTVLDSPSGTVNVGTLINVYRESPGSLPVKVISLSVSVFATRMLTGNLFSIVKKIKMRR